MTVLVVDDHEVVRRGVVEVVDADPDLAVVAEAGSVRDALVRAAAVRPDVAVIDLLLPDGTGIDLVRRLAAEQPGVRCVVLTSFDDDDAVTAAVEAGAVAFVLKTVRGIEIVDVIKLVAGGRNGNRVWRDRGCAGCWRVCFCAWVFREGWRAYLEGRRGRIRSIS